MKLLNRLVISGALVVFGLVLFSVPQAKARELAQEPSPAVTGTPSGPLITPNEENDYVNVRSGPGTEYFELGVLNAGEFVTAYGKTIGGNWIQIAFPGGEGGIGWVYAPLVILITGGDLPIIEPPPTATPLVTPTIDPTLAAQFIDEVPPTRLPTYTPPPPLVISTFESNNSAEAERGGGFPMGMAIIILGAVGILGVLFGLIRRR